MTDLHHETRCGISYTARASAGPTVLFLHGIGSNAMSFAPLFDLLPTHLNLLAWNAPGYLESEPMAELWPSPADYAQRLADLLDGLSIRTAHIVGHSLGTLIAAAFARQFPSRVDSLVLASAANGYQILRGSGMPRKVASRIEELNSLGPAKFAHSRAANLVYDPANNQRIVSHVEIAMAQVNPSGYAQAVRLLASGNLPEDVKHGPICPDFIVGAKDKITPINQTQLAASAWVAKQGRQPRVTIIENAGHAVYLQKPDEFCAALLALLSENCRINPAPNRNHEEV
jgi:pimeloyl-ACP methyl ester carboxylesterase